MQYQDLLGLVGALIPTRHSLISQRHSSSSFLIFSNCCQLARNWMHAWFCSSQLSISSLHFVKGAHLHYSLSQGFLSTLVSPTHSLDNNLGPETLYEFPKFR